MIAVGNVGEHELISGVRGGHALGFVRRPRADEGTDDLLGDVEIDRESADFEFGGECSCGRLGSDG